MSPKNAGPTTPWTMASVIEGSITAREVDSVNAPVTRSPPRIPCAITTRSAALPRRLTQPRFSTRMR